MDREYVKTGAWVFIVEYQHKHGTDVWVCASNAGMIDAVSEAMHAWLGDVEKSKRPAIEQAIEQRDLHKAIRLWEESTEERFCVRQVQVTR